jgi:signal transduction histidine kinase/ActR/RegA family two-component response regulator
MVSSSTVPAGAGEAWPEQVPPEHEYRVLIFAPTGNDARLTADFLAAAGIDSLVVGSMRELCHQILAGCGAVLLAEEVMTSATAIQLFALLRHQPTWSDVPVTLVTTGGSAGVERLRRLAAFGANSNVTVLERPFRPSTLVSALEVAQRSRRRQYQVRKLLAELSQARDTAERASRAKDDFLAALSHELRTPLNPVLLLASEAAANPRLPEPVRNDFDQIAQNVMLEARLIDDLLDLTRITRGKLSLDLRTVSAHAALRSALETVQAEIHEKRLTLQLQWMAGKDSIQADIVRLQQIFWNILKNAAKFTPPEGHIRVATSDNGTELTIQISDTGVGMNESELARVFDAFVQGNHATENNGHRFGGLGLGLAISRRLVDLHGGRIVATSDGPGHGASFALTFPLVAQPSAVPEGPVSPGGTLFVGADRRRLLLVDDHAATRASLKRLLERRGYHVTVAGGVEEARSLVRGERFDLLLSDIGLPDGDGYALMSELRKRWGLPGIALSGYGMEADVILSKQAGFSEHLTKPVSVHALDAALAGIDRMQAASSPASPPLSVPATQGNGD